MRTVRAGTWSYFGERVCKKMSEDCKESNGMFECFHCLHRSLLWQSDFMFEDYGYEGNGIVQNLICTNCGAEVEYRVPLDEDEDE